MKFVTSPKALLLSLIFLYQVDVGGYLPRGLCRTILTNITPDSFALEWFGRTTELQLSEVLTRFSHLAVRLENNKRLQTLLDIALGRIKSGDKGIETASAVFATISGRRNIRMVLRELNYSWSQPLSARAIRPRIVVGAFLTLLTFGVSAQFVPELSAIQQSGMSAVLGISTLSLGVLSYKALKVYGDDVKESQSLKKLNAVLEGQIFLAEDEFMYFHGKSHSRNIDVIFSREGPTLVMDVAIWKLTRKSQ